MKQSKELIFIFSQFGNGYLSDFILCEWNCWWVACGCQCVSDEHIEPAKNQTLTQSFIKNNLVFECHRNVGALRGVDYTFWLNIFYYTITS